MPAKSKAQQKAMAIAMHNPRKLYRRNRGMAQMGEGSLRDFAETPTKGLPTYSEHVKKVMGRGK